jgi:hypothetical protein
LHLPRALTPQLKDDLHLPTALYSAMNNPPPRRKLAARILEQEDLNFLLTNRLPRAAAHAFHGLVQQDRATHWSAMSSIGIWRLFADLDLSEARSTSLQEHA